jgi:hypothetical protein
MGFGAGDNLKTEQFSAAILSSFSVMAAQNLTRRGALHSTA